MGTSRSQKVISVMFALQSVAATAASAEIEVVQPEVFQGPGAVSAAWADFDNDGWLDLAVAYQNGDQSGEAVAYQSGEVRLYRNNKGVFVNVGQALGLPLKGDSARGVAWGDYDGDGYPDLYVGTLVEPIPSRSYLYHNERGTGFVEVAKQMGVDDPGSSSRQANWIDYNNDGHLDLFVANRSGTNHLFRNEGGHFKDVTQEVGLTDRRRTVGACWFDMNQDGHLDLFIGNQEGDTDGVYKNNGGHFVDIAPELHMDRPGRRLDVGSNMCAVGDYDNDGKLDLFVAAYGQSALYHNDGGGHFTEVGKAMGVAIEGHMVSAEWGDYDNDGRLDLYVAGYTLGENGKLVPKDYLFHNEGGYFVNVLTADNPLTKVLSKADHGVQWADYDRDGALDLALTSLEGGVTLLHNLLPAEARRRSLEVAVLDQAGHQTCPGSEVRLYDPSGKLLGTRLVATGDGYGAQSVQPVHFGLPRMTRVTVEVTYLTATGRKTQRVENVDPSKLIGKTLVVRQTVN
jgi:hypothetical protein